MVVVVVVFVAVALGCIDRNHMGILGVVLFVLLRLLCQLFLVGSFFKPSTNTWYKSNARNQQNDHGNAIDTH
jgi:hypothetical protein